MRQVIDNLFRSPEPAKRFCRVVKPLSSGRYQVQDTQGRKIDVDADATWPIGDGVTVSQGRIVSRAARFIKPKTYEV